ncbi:orotidine-5'-phosphate decarboxylase [Phragmitibacter flavus]|uniref:Orotidine-5'-phosphate decarboxylase n=1 Tax=Phragmitibacter flavus TaxID=2576071 RepID=A0A5R8KBX9_9BACT|nr:orotidine-5'-phosphate decarboxylase [Phragmitibacter flavus]TLD69791.1 orotidine-5'-phosphate decarboxylase [Phragmitibacter flavus]
MTYLDKLNTRIAATNSHLCVGLDVRANTVSEARDLILKVIEETAPYTAAYKPNAAYFEALGWQGMQLLEELRDLIPTEIPIVLDVKRGDIGETQRYYAKACYDIIRADAVTLNPFMGRDTLEPFLEYTDKGFYLLCVTSNPGAADIELQKTTIGNRHIFELVCDMLQGQSQGGLVLGLTNAAADTLSLIPDVPLLIPGLGAQGGDLNALQATPRHAPPLINVSRGILYAEPEKSFTDKAQHWSQLIQKASA